MKPAEVRHYRNGPGIDVCYGCGARGGDKPLMFAQTMRHVTCKPAIEKLRTKRASPAGRAAWVRKMAKVTAGKLRERGWL